MTGCKEVFCYSASYLAFEAQWVVTAGDGIQVVAGYWDYDESRRKIGRLGEGAHFKEKWRTSKMEVLEVLEVLNLT